MRFLLSGCCVILLIQTPVDAQIRKFPYEGLVESDAAYVRSGPGKQFYPTVRLNRGSRVTVHRHDPGGWYMIAPMPGSFSWIRADYVQKTAAKRGLITQNNVVVRVGSTFGDETREVEQVRLSKNDQVEILEEKTLTTAAGPVRHYKITPPTGEYRWVSGKFITPVNQIVRKQQDANPFEVPSDIKKAPPLEARKPIAQNPVTQPLPNVFDPPQAKQTGSTAIHRSGPDPAVLATQREQLSGLDSQFRTMVNGRTQDWSFTSLEQGYRQLQQEAALPALAHQIDLRFAAIQRYQKIKNEYDELVKLTNDAKQRDAQLMSIQQQQQLPEPAPTPSPTPRPEQAPEAPLTPLPDPFGGENSRVPQPVELPGLEPVEPNPPPFQQPQSQPQPTPPPFQQLQPKPEPAPPSQPRSAPNVPRFDGAGIVQRAAGTGGPAYVLMTPQGRVLAYLQPVQGLNLEPYVGKAMGIYGQRSYRREWRMDHIIVRSLTPVRLAP